VVFVRFKNYFFLLLLAPAGNNFCRRQRQRLKFLSDVADSADKYNPAIFKPKP
jgi:hypothetical protein